MASSAISELGVQLRFRHRSHEMLERPREWEAGTMVLVGLPPDRWADTRVYVQGQEVPCRLERLPGVDGPQVCAGWDKVDAGAWQIRVRVGQAEGTDVVRVQPRKLSPQEFETLVSDLEERLPASIIIALKQLGAFGRLHWKPPGESTLAQELVRLRAALHGSEGLPGLLAVLRDAARRPHHVLTCEERWMRAEAARQPVPARLAAALARPGNMMAEGVLGRVLDRRIKPSFDTYENRLLREFATQVDRRLRALKRAADLPESFRNQHGAELDGLLRNLRVARRAAAFLDEVGPLRAAPDRLTQVLLRRPPYRAALRGYIQLRRSPRIRLDHPAMDAPIQDVPKLYEAWCTLTVAQELMAVAEPGGWEVVTQRLTAPNKVQPFVSVLPGGAHPLLVLRRGAVTASVFYQRCFGPKDTDLRSISYAQTPDMALEVSHADGGRVLHLLDPKYKLRADDEGKTIPVKEDVDKMHAYRDAIRDQAGQRVVSSAAILYPGEGHVFGSGIGALGLLPGVPHAGLRRWLAQALRRQDVGTETDEAEDADAREAVRTIDAWSEADDLLFDLEGPEAVLRTRVIGKSTPQPEDLSRHEQVEAEQAWAELVAQCRLGQEGVEQAH